MSEVLMRHLEESLMFSKKYIDSRIKTLEINSGGYGNSQCLYFYRDSDGDLCQRTNLEIIENLYLDDDNDICQGIGGNALIFDDYFYFDSSNDICQI